MIGKTEESIDLSPQKEPELKEDFSIISSGNGDHSISSGWTSAAEEIPATSTPSNDEKSPTKTEKTDKSANGSDWIDWDE